MNSSVPTCRVDAFVSDCGRLMGELDVACIPVLDYQKRLIGVLTDRDLALRVVGEHRSADTRASSVMSTDFASCSPDDSLDVAEAQMRATKKWCAVVVDRERRVLGLLSLADIAREAPSSLRARRWELGLPR
jgi:CBS domain-containing protein